MIILPAIDLYDGKAVRLFKGDYSQMTVYSDNPVGIALDFKNSGAEWMHLVDLEGAKSGLTPNIEMVKTLVKTSGLKAEVGGGIRSLEVIEKYIDAGLSRVILGTKAVTDEQFLLDAVKRYGDKIAVGVDMKDGFVAIKGWTEKSTLGGIEFCKKMQTVGVKTLIVTDISRDGAMKGSNCELYRELSEKVDIDIIASGGVTDMTDIEKLRALNLYGAIVGKAYYQKTVDIRKAIGVAK